jgi:hypothetical protein
VYAKFGKPLYYIREEGTNSEVYPVDDEDRSQAGTVRVWYIEDRVISTGCYMTNKKTAEPDKPVSGIPLAQGWL